MSRRNLRLHAGYWTTTVPKGYCLQSYLACVAFWEHPTGQNEKWDWMDNLVVFSWETVPLAQPLSLSPPFLIKNYVQTQKAYIFFHPPQLKEADRHPASHLLWDDHEA